MPTSLCFQSVQFDVIDRNSQPWVRSPQIAEALGYGQTNRINDLYTRHADEFTPSMTAVVTLPTEGGPQEVRLFSLRGCHLLAMFARTHVAKAFRKWVLDVLDSLNREQTIAAPNPRPCSTATDRNSLRALVTAWAKISKLPQTVLWPQVCAHFLLDQINDLPVERIPDALAWVQMKIDALPKATREERLALPAYTSGPSYREQCAAITARMYELRGTLFRVSTEMDSIFRAPFWSGTASRDLPESKREFASAMNHAIQRFFMSVNNDIEAAGLLFTAYVEGEKVLRG